MVKNGGKMVYLKTRKRQIMILSILVVGLLSSTLGFSGFLSFIRNPAAAITDEIIEGTVNTVTQKKDLLNVFFSAFLLVV